MSNSDSPVYQQRVIDFVACANEFCTCLEEINNSTLGDFIKSLNLLLPKMYAAAIDLPLLDAKFEEFGQRFVNEQDYEYLKNMLAFKLGQYDSFEEVFDRDRVEYEDAVAADISEYLADIYQDIKDFLLLYQLGSEEVMYEAIWECQQNMAGLWGQKLVNVLRPIHYLNYSEDVLEENEVKQADNNNNTESDTSNWIISRRQQDIREDEQN